MKTYITSFDQLDLNKTYSYADYLTWKIDEMVEIFKGKVQKMSPAPLRLHQKVAANIHGEFYLLLKGQSCDVYEAPFDVRLYKSDKSNSNVITVVQPDICIICDKSKLDDRGCIGSPDLIVEILSKSTKKRDIHDKYDLYEENAVLEYWIVDPYAPAIDIFKLENGNYELFANYIEKNDLIKSSIFPEMKIKWEDIFTE